MYINMPLAFKGLTCIVRFIISVIIFEFKIQLSFTVIPNEIK